jgi:hypothetical protein
MIRVCYLYNGQNFTKGNCPWFFKYEVLVFEDRFYCMNGGPQLATHVGKVY